MKPIDVSWTETALAEVSVSCTPASPEKPLRLERGIGILVNRRFVCMTINQPVDMPEVTWENE